MGAKKTGQRIAVNSKRWPGVYYYESDKKRHQGKPDVCYYINFRADGKLKWEKVGWKSEGYTPQVADDLRSKRIREYRHTGEVKTQKEIRQELAESNRTLDEIAEVYFANRGGSRHAAKTDRNRYNRHVAPVLGKRTVSNLAPLDMERIKKRMEGLSAATKWGALEITRRVINFGARNGLCPPLGFVIKMPKRDNEVVEYLEPEQLRGLLEVLESWPNPDVSRMLLLALYTGMRRGEIFKLQTGDVDFRQSLITLRRPKGGRTVSIPMNSVASDVLQAQLEWRDSRSPDSDFVFPGASGGKRVDCTGVKRIKKAAKLPANFRIFHGLRHHFAVTLANSGEFSLDMIGQLLTHKSAAMTKRYAQFLPDTVKQASDRAAELISGANSYGSVGKTGN